MRIAPRLANGEKRIPTCQGLPEEIRKAINDISRKEGKSKSWVLQEIIIDWAHSVYRIPLPKYVQKKENVIKFRKRA